MVRPWLNLAVAVLAVIAACVLAARLAGEGPHLLLSQVLALSGAVAYMITDYAQVRWSLRNPRARNDRARHLTHF